VVKAGVGASMFWGIAGMLVGVIIALQLSFSAIGSISPIKPGRISAACGPCITSAVIFAFGGNVLIATAFYVVQRTCQRPSVRRFALLAVFWGYNIFIRHGGTGYLWHHPEPRICRAGMVCRHLADGHLGLLSCDFLGTLIAQGTAHLCRQLVLSGVHRHHRGSATVVNNLPCRSRSWKAKLFPVFRRAGCVDPMGGTAKRRRLLPDGGFPGDHVLLIPKRAERPVYSYRLSISISGA
jgi:cytochrome c oxidase cbb3-type subunit 1